MILKILAMGPMTDEQIVNRFASMNIAASPSGIRSRRAELVRAGKVVEHGESTTAAGNVCSVWRLP
jgi:hypothetical protein